MLQKTFIHIPGVGDETERNLWLQGCDHWDVFLQDSSAFKIGGASRDLMVETLERSKQALAKGEHQFFRASLGAKDAWRAFEAFRHSCVYLDIETDGGQSGESITTVGLYDGTDFQCLVKGDSLGNFPDVISRYSLIVTFFGNGFDLPMLRKKFPKVSLDQIHIDLCPTLRRLGYRGGLKRIEVEIGISRPEETQGLGGLDAIRLWRQYKQRGDEDALRTLIAYNREDVVNLEVLAELAYRRLSHQITPRI